MNVTVHRLVRLWERTTRAEREAGASWYDAAHAFALESSTAHSLPLTRVVGIVAALSPRCQWDLNRYATTALLWGAPRVSTITRAPWTKALAIHAGRWPGATAFPLRTCPKTNSFYHNILAPSDPRFVTIDRHAARIVGIGTDHRFDYWSVAQSYIEAARYANVRPNVFQATLWLVQRNGGQMELELKRRQP